VTNDGCAVAAGGPFADSDTASEPLKLVHLLKRATMR
jgi:hypothetical protein